MIRHRLKALQEIVAALERELKLPSISATGDRPPASRGAITAMKAQDASDILDSRMIRHQLKALQEIVAALERELKLPSINLK